MPGRDSPIQILDLDPVRLAWRPPGADAWLRAQEEAPGPASLCLALLGLGGAALAEPAAGQALEHLPAGLLSRLLARLAPPAWLTEADRRELAELEAHLRCLADFPGLSCAACAQQEQAGEGPPPCAACPLPPLPAASRPALRLYALLRRLPPGAAAALLPAALGPLGAGQARLLLERLALIHGLLGPGPGLARPGEAC
ncbi:MAG: hypothetical protein AB1814_05035 [Thermodesulfobacteriota bacterium]